MSGDIYAIGDIHGSLDLLERLLDKINPDLTRDRLVFMGDYIDRGPHPKGVVDYVLRLKNLAPPEQVICLKGNHEAMFLNFLQGGPVELFLFNGGLSTLGDYWGDDWVDRDELVLPPDHPSFLRNCGSIMRPRIISSSTAASNPGCPWRSRGKKTCCGSGGISSPPWRISARR